MMYFKMTDKQLAKLLSSNRRIIVDAATKPMKRKLIIEALKEEIFGKQKESKSYEN